MTTIAHDYELCIAERSTPFTELDFCEPIDTDRLRRIIHSQELRDRWLKPTKPMGRYYQNDITGGSSRDANTCYELEKKALMKMLKKAKRGKLMVKYAFGKFLKVGRCYAIDSMSIGCINKDVRHTLCGDRWVDIDIVCCHPNLMVQLCEKQKNTIRCEVLREYINKREEILAETAKEYNVTREDAKQLFNILTFGGGLNTWLTEYLDVKDTSQFKMTTFVAKYHSEMAGIAKLFYNNNPKIAKELTKERYKAMYSITHYLLGDYERQILETAFEFALDDDVLDKLIVEFGKLGTVTGAAGATIEELQQYANSFGVSELFDNKYWDSQRQAMFLGTTTAFDIQNDIKTRAAAAYPAWAEGINAGKSMDVQAGWLKSIVAKDLGIDPNTLSWDDPMIMPWLNWVDPKTNKQAIPPMYTVRTENRRKNFDAFARTPEGTSYLDGLTVKVLQDMGLI